MASLLSVVVLFGNNVLKLFTVANVGSAKLPITKPVAFKGAPNAGVVSVTSPVRVLLI